MAAKKQIRLNALWKKKEGGRKERDGEDWGFLISDVEVGSN